LFITENSPTSLGGFEIPKEYLGISRELEKLYAALNEGSDELFRRDLIDFKDKYKGAVPFKKYLKNKITKYSKA